jgi:predicted nucleic acid-binding protein
VVDASVILNWLLREDANPMTDALRELHESGMETLVAPELISYEVANVLSRKLKLGPAAAADMYSDYEALEIVTYSLDSSAFHRVLALCAGCGISAYDASYASLSEALNAPLATLDRRLEEGLRREGIRLYSPGSRP